MIHFFISVLVVCGSLSSAERFEHLKYLQSNISDDALAFSTGINAFAFKLFKELLQEERGNVFFSPFSVSWSTLILSEITSGDTRNELLAALNLQPPSGSSDSLGPTLDQVRRALSHDGAVKLGNRAFVDSGAEVEDWLKEERANPLSAAAEVLDFRQHPESSRRRINLWTRENTEDNIQELLQQGTVNSDTRVVLVSTIFFKETWHYPFPVKATRERSFHTTKGETQQVPMMKTTRRLGLKPLPTFNSSALFLPYQDGRQTFVIILPDEKDGLPALEKALTEEDLKDILWEDITFRKVKAIIPKFRFQQSKELKAVLRKLGIEKIFDRGLADFSRGLKKSNGLEVSGVHHSACIQLDEAGTEAAAATGVVVALRSGFMVDAVPNFTADHPFIFAITDNQSKCVLFLGRYALPP